MLSNYVTDYFGLSTGVIEVLAALLVLTAFGVIAGNYINFTRLKNCLLIRARSFQIKYTLNYFLAVIWFKKLSSNYSSFMNTAMFVFLTIMLWGMGMATILFITAILIGSAQ